MISTGTSGTTHLILQNVLDLSRERRFPVDWELVRAGLIGAMVSVGNHTVHEIMRGAALWDAQHGGKYGLEYTDDWRRYRSLGTPAEEELRRNVAVDGLFPDEIVRGAHDSPFDESAETASGILMLKALRVDARKWEELLESAGVGSPKPKPRCAHGAMTI
ncbi:hypothetical protein [Actinomadura sp. DC4]|uniref:hypothetical protein n=1 Tax=Actinomadura sp. DC4 TaxID=3055069 RepID=UPI0025B140B4|nr:hypothetical protein [Actinomadura sp. DC4]MDN3354954.1 hypothetical protein [Actinomadura sp. DC4]